MDKWLILQRILYKKKRIIYQSLVFTRKLIIGVNDVFGGICKSFYFIVLYKNACLDKTLDNVSRTNLRPTYHEPLSQ
jgi:hypothetical protein